MRWLCTTSSLLLFIVADRAQDGRLRVPDAPLLNKARAAIQDVFGADIAKAATAEARGAIAAKMLEAANDPKESAANRWVLYVQARDLALAAGNVPLMVRALDELTKTFAVNRRETCAETFEKIKMVPPGSAKPLVDLISTTADEAISADDYASAVKLLEAGGRIARLGKETAAAKRFDFRVRAVSEQAKLFDSAKADDEVLGKFLCFRKGDWAKGLPLLAKSKDAELAQLAKRDLRDEKDVKAQADLGLAWVDFAEKMKAPERIAIMKRGAFWGMHGAEGLTGLAKAKIEQKLAKAFTEIDEADAAEGAFSLYTGAWVVHFSDNSTKEYVIDAYGHLDNHADGVAGALARVKGAVLYQLSNGKWEHLRYTGNAIQVEQFAALRDYPNKALISGLATPKK